jgi:uncharacterized protein (UPF0276 family)
MIQWEVDHNMPMETLEQLMANNKCGFLLDVGNAPVPRQEHK